METQEMTILSVINLVLLMVVTVDAKRVEECECNTECVPDNTTVEPKITPKHVENFNTRNPRVLNSHFDLCFERITKETFDKDRTILEAQIRKVRLACIDAGAFEQLRSLRKLELGCNRLTYIHRKMFKGLRSLRTLGLCFNEINYIESCSFRGFHTDFSTLDLKINKLRNISKGTFCGLTRIETLDLRVNEIAHIYKGAFSGLRLKRCRLILKSVLWNMWQISLYLNPKKKDLIYMPCLEISTNSKTFNEKTECIRSGIFTGLQVDELDFTGRSKINYIEHGGLYMSKLGKVIIFGGAFTELSWKAFLTMHGKNTIPQKSPITLEMPCNSLTTKGTCWIYHDQKRFSLKARGENRKCKSLNKPVGGMEQEWEMECPGQDLCMMNLQQCNLRCFDLGYDVGHLIYHDFKCPFKYFCTCHNCTEFDEEVCENYCMSKGLRSLSNATEGGCRTCECSCPLFNRDHCAVKCSKLGKIPVVNEVNDRSCPVCKCQCPEVDCDKLCDEPGLGIRKKNEAGCTVCDGCRSTNATVICVDCEKDCNGGNLGSNRTNNRPGMKNKHVNNSDDEYLNKSLFTTTVVSTAIDNQPLCYQSCGECPSNSEKITWILITVFGSIALIVFIASITIYLCTRFKQYFRNCNCTKKEELVELDFGFQGDVKLILLIKMLNDDLAEEVTQCWTKPNSFTLGHLIGHGNFGTVWSGTLFPSDNNEAPIAIKKIKGRRDKDSVESFLNEAVVLRQFNHPHVMSLIGVSVHEDIPCVLLPFMSNGDLRSYIRSHRTEVKHIQLFTFSLQIAKGMKYLEEQKFVHCDLAARNCMLNSDLIVKVGDFGMTRDVYQRNYYKTTRSRALPIKWMSIEAIQEGLFSSKSDVWSYGVVLWELFTFGAEPYEGIHNIDVREYLRRGKRLSSPRKAPTDICDIMFNCWHVQPEERPSFADITTTLEGLVDTNASYLEVIAERTKGEEDSETGRYLGFMEKSDSGDFTVENDEHLSSLEIKMAEEPNRTNVSNIEMMEVKMVNSKEASSRMRNYKENSKRPIKRKNISDNKVSVPPRRI